MVIFTSRPVVVIDLEATCWKGEQTIEQMEVIEFGCVLADVDGNIYDQFETFVRPVERAELTDFCTELTSIRQADVDIAPVYCQAVELVDAWLWELPKSAIWASWGNYDRRQLLVEKDRHGCAPSFMRFPHVNAKKLWRKTTGHIPCGLLSALAYHKMDFEGRHHRGISDAQNITRLLPKIDRGILNAAISHRVS